jgi:AAA15 family ATPase/GTPase
MNVDNGFIGKLTITDFYSINKIQLDELKNKKVVFFLGENGTGKTVLLRALLIALKNSFINKHTSKETSGVVFQMLEDNKKMSLNFSIYKNKNLYHYQLHQTFYLKNCYAYGTQRNNISQTKKAEEYGFLTLFKPDEIITNAEFWLQDLKFQELEGRKTIRVKDFEIILGDLLDVEDLELTVSSKEVSFKINNQKKSFKELSEGYQSVINLVTDLTARLVENNDIQSVADLKATQAVVLIDELDLFLHPKWEKNICGKLHEKFPNIQFFITTHSPILIDGALKDKRINNTSIEIIKLGLQNGETVVERRYSGDLIEDWTPNLLINSNLFDNDYLNDLDEEQVQQLKSEGNEAELLRVAKSLKIVSKREEELRQRYLKDLKSTVL